MNSMRLPSITKDSYYDTEATITHPGRTTCHRQKPVQSIQEIHTHKQREVQAVIKRGARATTRAHGNQVHLLRQSRAS